MTVKERGPETQKTSEKFRMSAAIPYYSNSLAILAYFEHAMLSAMLIF